jgi:hypothetical protein
MDFVVFLIFRLNIIFSSGGIFMLSVVFIGGVFVYSMYYTCLWFVYFGRVSSWRFHWRVGSYFLCGTPLCEVPGRYNLFEC